MTHRCAFTRWAPAVAVAAAVAFALPAAAALAQSATSIPVSSGNVTTAKPSTKPSAATAAKETSRSGWADLSPAQQKALQPLAGAWIGISEAQKRKWLALSQNYPGMTPAEQAMLHSRMTEWVAMSAQERSQARLNFAETKKLSPDDKKAKWEAYQALSPQEKAKLASGAAVKSSGAAVAVKPIPPQKLATMPQPQTGQKAPPRIAAAPHQVDQNTLLPQAQPAISQ